MSGLSPAARKTEWIAHDNSQHIKFLVWATTTVLQARYIALPFAWTPAGAAIFVGSVLVEWAVGTFVLDPLSEAIGEALASPPVPRVCTGSPNVTIQDLPAVRGQQKDKTDTCHAADVEQGSQWVSINLKPASRWGDRTSCSGGATIQRTPVCRKKRSSSAARRALTRTRRSTTSSPRTCGRPSRSTAPSPSPSARASVVSPTSRRGSGTASGSATVSPTPRASSARRASTGSTTR